ncbi:MAG: hypothetical protein WCB27_03740, partial [Thermoguttaceae bacterium]
MPSAPDSVPAAPLPDEPNTPVVVERANFEKQDSPLPEETVTQPPAQQISRASAQLPALPPETQPSNPPATRPVAQPQAAAQPLVPPSAQPAAQPPSTQPPVQPPAQPPTEASAQRPSPQSPAQPAAQPLAQSPASAGASEPETVPAPLGTASDAKTGLLGAAPPPSSDDSLITLHADELDVRKVLEMLSRQGNVGMAFSPGVSGKITLDIKNKTLDEALTIIAGLCHLNVRRENDVIFISTSKELRQTQEDNLPVRVYHLNYVRSKDVKDMIANLKSPKGQITSSPDSQTGLSSGSVGGGGGGSSGGGGGGGGGGG